MGVYYIMIIIKILRKRISIDRIFALPSLSNYSLMAIEGTTLSCSPSGYTPSDDYGISTCHSNEGFPKRQFFGNR